MATEMNEACGKWERQQKPKKLKTWEHQGDTTDILEVVITSAKC